MVRIIAICDTSACDDLTIIIFQVSVNFLAVYYLSALDALGRKLVLIASGAVDVILLGDE